MKDEYSFVYMKPSQRPFERGRL